MIREVKTKDRNNDKDIRDVYIEFLKKLITKLNNTLLGMGVIVDRSNLRKAEIINIHYSINIILTTATSCLIIN